MGFSSSSLALMPRFVVGSRLKLRKLLQSPSLIHVLPPGCSLHLPYRASICMFMRVMVELAERATGSAGEREDR